MGYAATLSRACIGIQAPLVTVEVHITNGLPLFSIVGLPETAVRESKDRVRSAIINSDFEFPRKRITVNLAPAELPKPGTRFDLAIAVGILAASEQIKSGRLYAHELYAELSLDGGLRPVPGCLPAAVESRAAKHALIVDAANAGEAALVEGGKVFGARSLLQVVEHLIGVKHLAAHQSKAYESEMRGGNKVTDEPDLSEIRGQAQGKRALEIASAGAHNLLLIGPPGTGKTMLATRIPGLLPPLPLKQALELAAVLSVAGQPFDISTWRSPPFRSPHHSCSAVALIGGGARPRPGEVSLAHRGVLFLDELPEFDRRALEALREPLESGRVFLSRAAYHIELPARVQLVCAMNSCPCGNLGSPEKSCRCTLEQVNRYHSKLSGPLLDRIDIRLEVTRQSPPPGLPAQQQCTAPQMPQSPAVRDRVASARHTQLERSGEFNAHLTSAQLRAAAPLRIEQREILIDASNRLGLSERGQDRILRVSRTIADLQGCEEIDSDHLLEALSLRSELCIDALAELN